MDNPPHTGPVSSGLEARVARIEVSVEYIQRDIAEMRGALTRLATVVDRMNGMVEGTLPSVATKGELANFRADVTREIGTLEVEIARRPTTLGMIVVVVVLIVIAGLPYWGHWFADLKAMVGAYQ